MFKATHLISLCLILTGATAFAGNAPKVGRNAAAKYFQGETKSPNNDGGGYQSRHPSSIESLSADERYLMFGASTYISSDSYKWGAGGVDHEENIGKWGVDMTYRLGVYNNIMDEALRVSYTEYEPTGKRASQLSFLYTLMLPDAGSKFPLYFGLGAGPGIFFKQLENESPLALDYQLFLGLRLFNLLENTGFFVEGGMKNHLQLTSDGQLNGTYISAGAVFAF